jgi:hypothetical protein
MSRSARAEAPRALAGGGIAQAAVYIGSVEADGLHGHSYLVGTCR